MTEAETIKEYHHTNLTWHRIREYQNKNKTFYKENRGKRPVSEYTIRTWKRKKSELTLNYERLCNEDNHKHIETNNYECANNFQTSCRISHAGNYYTWSKEEILNMDPWIILIHDFVTDRESEKFKTLAMPQLKRAIVGGLAEKGELFYY